MSQTRASATLLALIATLLSAACAARGTSTGGVAPKAPAPVARRTPTETVGATPVVPQREATRNETVAPAVDAVALLVARSTAAFEEGLRQLRDGRLDEASRSFALAVDVLSNSPEAARGEAGVVEQLDRLSAAIKAAEVQAVAAPGDALNEQPSAPAPRDALFDAVRSEPLGSPPTLEAIQLDVASTDFDIDVPLTPQVLSFVQMYTGNPRMRGFLEDGLSRGARYLPMVQEIFRAEGLPLDLAYVPLVESAFKTSALSRANARGIWQFMLGTGLEQGLRRDWYVDERADPEKATRAAARFLQQLYEQFGNWHLALASYNGGPGRVQGAMRRSGKRDYWEIRESTRFLPRETRDYVPLVLAAVIVARNPARYGLTVTPAEPPEVETVTIESPVDIRLVALWTGRLLEEIRELNPELRRWTTPLRASTYELRVPAGMGDVVRARMAETPADALVPLDRHTVRKGETLRTLARTLKVTQADLAEANYLSTRAKLETGQQLIVPLPPALPNTGELVGSSAVARVASTRAPSTAAAVAGAAALTMTAASAGEPTVESTGERPLEPTAAQALRSPPAALPAPLVAVAAPSPAPTARAGAVTAPARVKSEAAGTAPAATVRRQHRVQRGDTLTSIARLYRTTVDSLRTWNRLSGNRIVVGQMLTILLPPSRGQN